jgi:ornithine carbamoyltransferase
MATTSTRSVLRSKDLLSLHELSSEAVGLVLDSAATIKRDYGPFRRSLDGMSVAMIFEKPSLRTRVTFDVGIAKLGGHAVYLDQSAQKLGEREAIKDFGRNLERWVDCVVARVYSQASLEELAAHCDKPVVNALSDRFHPCQALADFLTLRERFGRLEGLTLAYVGDGNNVCHSLLHAAALTGVRSKVITPAGREPAPDVVAWARSRGASVELSNDPAAVAGADAVYTDVWVSMGASGPKGGERIYEPYRVTEEMMAKAGPKAVFMHCLPAHRGQEVTDGVIDSPRSVVYDQAENRMHAQCALLHHMLAC